VKHLDLTLPTPAENLACDEALLDGCDAGDGPEVLRFWEPQRHFVVVGYSNKVAREVNVEVCQELGIPILRRCSGGGTVLQGPGCLNYSLILRVDSDPALQTVTGTNRFVMERNRQALEKLLSGSSQRTEALSSKSALRTPHSAFSVCGHTDLAVDNRKFSGNAQRRKRCAVLFHGSFLLNFDLALIEKVLPMPSKQPAYRQRRSHAEFLMNLNASASEVKAALCDAWGAAEVLKQNPAEDTRELCKKKYSTGEWNLKF
jgi:lipoate-protein ligase A